MNDADPDLATRADLADLGADIRNGFDELLPVLRDIAQAAAAHHPHTPSAQPRQTASGNSTITVNAGGIGLWVAVTCCVVMLATLIPMALALYWVGMDSRDRGHQMNAIYQSVPGLRELVERQMELIDETRKTEPEDSP